MVDGTPHCDVPKPRPVFPTGRPYTPQDLLATVYRHLGIDPYHKFNDLTGRLVPLLDHGEPIRELV